LETPQIFTDGRNKATYNRDADNTSRDTNEVHTSGITQIFNADACISARPTKRPWHRRLWHRRGWISGCSSGEQL